MNRTKCQKDRDLALEEPSGTFAPICDGEGGYEKVQCYKEACWCVDLNGEERRGTRVEVGDPDCSETPAGQYNICCYHPMELM